MEEDCILRVHSGDVLLGNVDVACGVGVQGLLLALQHLLLMLHLPQLHLFFITLLSEFYEPGVNKSHL